MIHLLNKFWFIQQSLSYPITKRRGNLNAFYQTTACRNVGEFYQYLISFTFILLRIIIKTMVRLWTTDLDKKSKVQRIKYHSIKCFLSEFLQICTFCYWTLAPETRFIACALELINWKIWPFDAFFSFVQTTS